MGRDESRFFIRFSDFKKRLQTAGRSFAAVQGLTLAIRRGAIVDLFG